ncbi:Transcription initiation factor TFIID subunit 8 putative isoform 1 [Tripterygium wilfordii]|uniref:Transcription initiation factor TFIID subunit 8 putative isoform 1 n=1 Tax=Tripterygium wilfordii TaxID=458696 RepID=A0A7J7DMK7_TRIWF|nr:uncharacterized protein LOC119998183 [Tripterygium wilfordii]KAF5747316.1 Transcription initiation factor TFIID subunit 8 putative isoform 1 [Tripterygium wilfordii]
MALLGDDGQGYELARRLESLGVWRTWLGDTLYASFVHVLSSPSSWESFMRADEPKSRPQILLQLRARALLFDKASASLFLQSNSSSSFAVSNLNPNYLQLHADDIYYTLEDADQRRDSGVVSNTGPSKNQSKSVIGGGVRFGDPEVGNISQRFRNEEFPETWYSQFIEKHRGSRPGRLSFGDRESDKRTPEGMSNYLRLLKRHKRSRVAFNEDQHEGFGNPVWDNTANIHPSSAFDGTNDDVLFFPETMFPLNCVPDTALPVVTGELDDRKVELCGVLDTLPQVMTRSPVIIERLGIRPEYLSMEQRGSVHRGKNGSEINKKSLGPEQASQMSKKAAVRMLTGLGFEGGAEVPVEVLSQLLSGHICKLGRTLKVLADSYRQQYSALELIKMFLQTTGYSNLGALAELVKDGSRNSMQQSQHGLQSQIPLQQQNPLQLPQQIQRQMHAQMRQMVPQSLALQQEQLERMRRRQPPTPRTAMDTDKERPPLVQVKIENTELPMDGNIFNPMNPRYQQMQQLRQQQIAAMSNFQAQPSNQIRQMASLQIPQMQTPNLGTVRARPVKVEGFQELMGGDAALKHDSEGSKLASPSNK